VLESLLTVREEALQTLDVHRVTSSELERLRNAIEEVDRMLFERTEEVTRLERDL
jgi:hypothetical protein